MKVPKSINPISIVGEILLSILIAQCTDYLKDYLSEKLS